MKRTLYIIGGTGTTTVTTGLGTIIIRVLHHCAYAERCGYFPLIDLKHYQNQYFKDNREYKDNVWEYYFKQPAGVSLDDIKAEDKVIIAKNASHPEIKWQERPPLRSPESILTDMKTSKIKNELRKYLNFNEEIKLFIEQKCNEALKGENEVLGVLLRGTDYTQKQSYGEYIQPDVRQVIKDAKKLLSGGGFKKIYLATEDASIYKQFKREFKEFLIENTQYMYSDNYDKTKFLSEIKVERENHNYNLGLEYLASLYILSKCKGYHGGMTNGIGIAYLLSNWQHCYIYNIGRYGIYNSLFEKILSVKKIASIKDNYYLLTVFGIKLKIKS